LIECIFLFSQGIKTNELRRRLWPLVLGLTHVNESSYWTECSRLFDIYNNQWNSILPDQETRFTAYRERKSLIGKIGNDMNDVHANSIGIMQLSIHPNDAIQHPNDRIEY